MPNPLDFSVRFYMRPRMYASSNLTLLVRISVNGQEDAGFSKLPENMGGQVLTCPPRYWSQTLQKRTDRTAEATKFNELLQQVRERVAEIYRAQVDDNLIPSRLSVKEAFLGCSKRYTLSEAYREYMTHLYAMRGTEQGLKQKTLYKWEYGLSYLNDFLTRTKQTGLLAQEVTVGWATRFHADLMQQEVMSSTTASRYVGQVRVALSYLVQLDLLKYNPLIGIKLPKSKAKEVYFLEDQHLDKFWSLKLTGIAYDVWWWTGLMMLTGLDYVDAQRYCKNRSDYEVTTQQGPKIVIYRDKTTTECHIPVGGSLLRHLENRPKRVPSLKSMNDLLRSFELVIGFPHRFTTKIARKTAGVLFLRDYSIKAVSRILGHSSIAMTEQHYVKVTGNDVDRERAAMQNVPTSEPPTQSNPRPGSPFSHIYKAS